MLLVKVIVTPMLVCLTVGAPERVISMDRNIKIQSDLESLMVAICQVFDPTGLGAALGLGRLGG